MSLPPQKNLLKTFKTDVLIETGSYRGDGIQAALDAGYDNIISLELDHDQVEFCRDRFDLRNEANPLSKKIMLVEGDTIFNLGDAIMTVPKDKRITFWLDAHWQMFEGTEPGHHPFPLLDELLIIKKSGREDCNILIDDCLLWQPDIVGFSNQDILNLLFEINSEYQTQYFANPVIKNILAAYPLDAVWCHHCMGYRQVKNVLANPDDRNSDLCVECQSCHELIDFVPPVDKLPS